MAEDINLLNIGDLAEKLEERTYKNDLITPLIHLFKNITSEDLAVLIDALKIMAFTTVNKPVATTWEYALYTEKERLRDKELLKDKGANGWELFAIDRVNNYIFRRPLK